MDEFGWTDEHLAADARRYPSVFPDDPLYFMSLDFFGGSFLDASQQNLGQISAEFSSPNFGSIPQDHGLYQTEGQIYQAADPLIAGLAEPSTAEGCESNTHTQITNEAGVALRSWKCAFCDEVNSSAGDHRRHLKLHGCTCHQCGESFATHEDLTGHAAKTAHEAYRCNDCDAGFTRLDVLKRHRDQHLANQKKYSCSHCKRWRAPNGFARKDHLIQHLRNYHHIDADDSVFASNGIFSYEDLAFYACCLHEGCPLFRSAEGRGQELRNKPLFKNRGEFTKHVRKEHDETPFPCTKIGCKRIKGKGFFRKRDFLKHMKKEHDIVVEDAEDENVGLDENAACQVSSTT